MSSLIHYYYDHYHHKNHFLHYFYLYCYDQLNITVSVTISFSIWFHQSCIMRFTWYMFYSINICYFPCDTGIPKCYQTHVGKRDSESILLHNIVLHCITMFYWQVQETLFTCHLNNYLFRLHLTLLNQSTLDLPIGNPIDINVVPPNGKGKPFYHFVVLHSF